MLYRLNVGFRVSVHLAPIKERREAVRLLPSRSAHWFDRRASNLCLCRLLHQCPISAACRKKKRCLCLPRSVQMTTFHRNLHSYGIVRDRNNCYRFYSSGFLIISIRIYPQNLYQGSYTSKAVSTLRPVAPKKAKLGCRYRCGALARV